MLVRVSRTVFVVGLLVCLTVTVSCSTESSEGSRPDRPNILVILTDDQRIETLSAMREVQNLFVDRGTRFTRAFATTPQCCPSRASILTGRYAHNHNVQTNFDAAQLDEDSTIQAYLQEAGYRTATVGKYLNRIGPYADRTNTAISPSHFDDWATFLGGYYDNLFNVNGKLEPVKQYSTKYLMETSTELLEAFEGEDEQPWFLYVTPFAPHFPARFSPKYKDAKVPTYEGNSAIGNRGQGQPRFFVRRGGSTSFARDASDKQHRLLMSVDEMVRSIFDTLEKLDEERDTFAIFMSDNGLQWGEKGLVGKGYPYEQSIAVPLVVRWPGRVEGGATDDRIVANIDIMPTLMEVARIEADTKNPIDGRSLLEKGARKDLLLEFAGLKEDGIPRWAALRTGTELYAEYYGEGGEKLMFRELYDLGKDPFQLTNLASRPGLGDRVEEHSRRLKEVKGCSGAACP